MPLREEDARFAIALDLILTDPARQHIALILREDEQRYALVGEKMHWGERADQAFLRALREELGLTEIQPARINGLPDKKLQASGILRWQLAGLFGLLRPQRDPRFLQAPLATRAQVLSLTYLVDCDLGRLQQSARLGSSVLQLEIFQVTALPPLFLDHAELIRHIFQAEQRQRLPLIC
ncbi:NUDIX domain-containing protein [Thermogemmatispora sp.]|uniref:NUDIX domain-containing protein n=1 Tax=Thermogemmatispora sp. TaxID=1968838 RepID=UPI002ACC1F12|nr:NUDIX domain-containing protein [Thermogemmatispora sp.]